MADFQTALRAVSKAAAFAVPWNNSFNAIEGFLHTTNFCAAELSSRPNRAALLTSFVNHVFGINAKKWSSGVVFLGTDDLCACWLAFFGTRSASALASEASGSGSRLNSYNNGSNNGNKDPGNNNRGSNNTPAAVEHGSFVTDNIVSWLKAGFCAGPFLAPPVLGFRCNSILAVPQPGKVCVILNLSSPDGQSFNDNINDNLLESVVMSTARQVGYTIVDCGVGARIWKYDLRDAYKNVPAQPADICLQGFRWLGKFFVETQLIFGARTSVVAFDRLGDILLVIAIALSGIA